MFTGGSETFRRQKTGETPTKDYACRMNLFFFVFATILGTMQKALL
jgi:hypothetical protein